MPATNTNLEFLIGRAPIIIPHGILPDNFQPIEGSVYDSFAEGLPPVIFTNGEFLPISMEELAYLKDLYSRPMVSGGGPESIPQMPTMPQIPTNFENNFEAKIEQSIEKQPEKAVEKNDNQTQVPTVQPTTTPTTNVVAPEPVLVDIHKVFGQGTKIVSQQKVDEMYEDFKNGKLKLDKDPGEDAEGWLKWLLNKIFKSYYK